MCGICGIALSSASKRTLDRDRLVRARDTLVHRGPDDSGVYLSERAALAHRRLSIVDVEGGHQPTSSDDGRVHLVYNGEVYNHLELRSELERRGHVYRTRCDTETVLRLYLQHGPGFVERLRGMFAFAIWDEREDRLLLVRDRLGIKPLYFQRAEDGSLVFASEIKALLELGAVPAELNYKALPDYLANHAPSGSETLFAGVRRLLPGHQLIWRDGELEIRPYWKLDLAEAGTDDRPPTESVREFRDLLVESVRLRLMADVPLGVFLSGGIDSASITAIMARLVDEPIQSFSVAFAEREANELGYARAVARAFDTNHHEVVVTQSEFFDALPHLIWHEDEPIAHPSSVPLHFVAELAARHVKVVLTGEGADEMLGGYGRYWKTLMNLRWGKAYERGTPPPVRKALRAAIKALPYGSRLRQKVSRTFLYLPTDLRSIYFDNFAVFSRGQQRRLLSAPTRQRVPEDPYREMEGLLADAPALSPLDRLLYMDIRTYLHELLMKQDQMSMSASIESRVPFLDHTLVEFAMRLPQERKVHRKTTKWVLREAMKGILPTEILRRPKMGFPVPFGAWVRNGYRSYLEETVLGDQALDRGLFDGDRLRALVDEHMAGKADHSERLWSLVNLELWQRLFVDGDTRLERESAPSAAVSA